MWIACAAAQNRTADRDRAASRITPPGASDLPRRCRRRKTRHRSRPWLGVCGRRKARQLYGLRKQTPEPVFGIIKSVIGFRQFLLRGLDRVRGEWSLVTMAWNIKRMYALSLG